MNIRLAILLCVCIAVITSGVASAATQVGVAAAVNPAAEGTAPGGSVRSLTLGQNIIHNERIVTGENGLVHILLVDGTSLTVGANSDLTIDSFIYDPNANTAQVAATLTKGVLRFIGGRSSKTGGAAIDSPVGTVGIRGGIGIFGVFDGSGGSEQPAFHCLYGNCNAAGSEMQAGESAYFGEGGVQITPTTVAAVAIVEAHLRSSDDTDGGSGVDEGEIDESAESSGLTDPDEDPNGSQSDGDAAATNDPAQELVLNRDIRLLLVGPDGALGGDGEVVTLKLKKTDFPSIFAGTGTVVEEPHTGTAGVPFIFGGSSLSITGVLGESSLGDLTGQLYARTDFDAWLLTTSAGVPFYAVTGVAPDFATTFADEDNVRRYRFYADPFQDVAVPFFQNGILSGFDAGGISDIHVIESADPTEQPARLLQGWLSINGTGAAQQSGIGVTVGQFVLDEADKFGLEGQRSGSYRQSAGGSLTSLIGEVASVPGPTGDHVFGPNGTNFLLTDSGSAFIDVPNSGADPDYFTSIHVADLVGDNITPTQSLDGPLSGFAAAMVEGSLMSMRSGGLGVSVDFDAATNTLGGLLTVSDGSGSVEALFGEAARVTAAGGAPGVDYEGSSVYVDDDLFAAVQTGPDSVYFVTGDTLADDDFMPGSSICASCGFAEWGWWGGTFGSQAVHLGTWVAGDIATWSDVPTGRTTIEGHAIGSVAAGSTQYIAGSTSRLTWDATLGIGILTLVDFDGEGETYGGIVRSVGGSGDPALLTAVLYGSTSLGAAGLADAAFALEGSGVAGFLGDFELADGSYMANGTVLGALGGTAATAPLPFRILTASGSNGIVGGEGYDQSLNLTLSFGEIASEPALLAEGAIDQGSGPLDLTLQAFVGDEFLSEEVDGSSHDGVALSGTVYYGAELFSAYLLTVGGDVGNPLYAITGTPTDDADVFEGGNVRRYSLSLGVDPDVPVPFFRDGVIDLTAATYAGTDLYVVESAPSEAAQLLQAFLQIDGVGVDQQSAIGLLVGAGDGDGLSGARSGSYRSAAGDEIVSLSGTAATVAGPTGAELFGPNAQNFVLGADLDGAGAFTDASASGATDVDFNTLHVANLEESTTATQTLDGPLSGFAAAMVEGSLMSMRSGGLGVSVDFDAATNTLGGLLTVSDGSGSVEALFGEAARVAAAGGAPGVDYEGSSVYVDDDLFAAVQTGPDSVYFVTGDTLADDDFMALGSSICAGCGFAEWGWWGGTFGTGAVHLGTWVAGDIASWADVETDFGGSSDLLTFEGHAVASVAIQGEGTVQFIAGGTSRVTWSDELGIGLVTVADLNGFTYGGVLKSVGGGGDPALLTAVLYGYQQLGPSGLVDAAFARDGGEVAGFLGDFQLGGGPYMANGTMLGALGDAAEAVAPMPFRLLTSSSVYETASGEIINDPGEFGIVGGDATNDQDKTLTLAFDPTLGLKVTGEVDQEGAPAAVDVVLQAFIRDELDSEFDPAVVTGSTLDGIDLTGIVYYGHGLFSAYLLSIDGDPTRPFYAITGTPSDYPSVFAGTNVRQYEFFADPLQGVPVPFFQDGIVDFVGDPYASTDIYLVETPTPGEQWARVFQAWLQIEGTGAAQESAVGLTAGNFIADESASGLRSSRLGSYRDSSGDGIVNFFGGVSSIAGPTGGEVFGPNGENFLLSSNVDGNDLFGDVAAGGGGDSFSTIHVANLVSDNVTLTAVQTQRTLSGFAAGMVEGGSGSDFSVLPMMTGQEAGVSVEFVPGDNVLGGLIRVGDFSHRSEITRLQLAIGDGPGIDHTGASVFINDDMFAAGGTSERSLTNVLFDDGTVMPHRDGTYPVTYFLTADAVADYDFMGSATICECSFAEWGWWGGQPRLTDTSIGGDATALRLGIHLGTWAIGDIDTWSEFETALSTGQAMYQGHAIGSVRDEASAQYIAGGTVTMTWNADLGVGLLTLVDFDGVTYGGVAISTGAADALITAILYGDDEGVSRYGRANGAFVADGVDVLKGIIGDFGLRGGDYAATGTFVGEYNAGATAPTVQFPYRVLTAGADGIVQASGGEDQTLLLALSIDTESEPTLVASGELANAQTVTLEAFVRDEIGDERPSIATLDGDALTGTAYYGPGNFAAYLLFANGGDPSMPLYAITGMPTVITPASGVFQGSDVRTYAFTADPIQGVSAPFMLDVVDGFGAPVFDFDAPGSVITPIYVAETPSLENAHNPRVLQSWLAIQGTGPDQVSAVGVNVGNIFDDEGYSFETGRRGSYRADAEAGSYHFSGGIATVGVIDGQNEFFGPDAESFLLSTIIDAGDSLFDAPALGGSGDNFSTIHVAQLTTTPAGVGESVTGDIYTGFAAGFVTCPDCGSSVPYAMVSSDASGVELRLEATSRTIGGHIAVEVADFGPDELQRLYLGFGTDGTNSRSAFIDDDIFAARDSNDPTQTNALIDAGWSVVDVSQEPGTNAKTYVISSGAVPTDGADFMNGGSCSNCDFIKWGWWGTRADLTDGSSTQASASAHLGTWVAGDVSTHADIDTYHASQYATTNVSATYNGQAVGTVNNAGAQYVTGGSVQMNWDFGAREGTWGVSNYDTDKNFGGAIAANGADAAFMGELAGGLGTTALTGDVNGAFVSDGMNPAAGAIGGFSAVDGDWSTVGTFGASQTSVILPP